MFNELHSVVELELPAETLTQNHLLTLIGLSAVSSKSLDRLFSASGVEAFPFLVMVQCGGLRMSWRWLGRQRLIRILLLCHTLKCSLEEREPGTTVQLMLASCSYNMCAYTLIRCLCCDLEMFPPTFSSWHKCVMSSVAPKSW